MVVYYAQIIFIIKVKYACSQHFPGHQRNIMVYHLLLGLCLLKLKTCVTIFYMLFYVLILTQYRDSHVSSLVFFLYPCDLDGADPKCVVSEPLV